MCLDPANTIRCDTIQYNTIQSNPADTIWSRDTIQTIPYNPSYKSDNKIQPIQYPSSVDSMPQHLDFTPHILLIPPHLILHPPQRPLLPYLLSSSAAESSSAFFASDLDSAIFKADFLAFLITSPTGQSLEEICKCLMEPHWHRFCCFFLVDCVLWVIVPLPCWWYLFETVSLDYSPSHFSLKECYRIFVFWSLPACGRLSVAWHCILDSTTCSYWRWVFLLARTVQTLMLFISPSKLTLVSNMSWIQRWISPPHKRSYY